MKVQGPGGVKGRNKTKKKSGAGKADGAFSDLVAAGTQEKAATSSTSSIMQVDALLALQGAEDATTGRAKQRAKKRAGAILDALDNIREAMLGGGLTVGHMVNIADMVASHREQINDPKLTAILDEIDLRAQVELAKMSRSLRQA
jgi:hypothetical protein